MCVFWSCLILYHKMVASFYLFFIIRVKFYASSALVKPGYVIWLYLRRYADGEIKYFVSIAPESLPPEELDRAATLR